VYVKDMPLPRRSYQAVRAQGAAVPAPRRPAPVARTATKPPPAERTARPPAAERVDHRHDPELLERARVYLEQGQPDAAMEVLHMIAPQSPLASRALTLIAQVHADRGQMEQAIAEVRRALELDRMNEGAYLLLGTIYIRQGLWNQAVQELERARYLNTASALVSFHLAAAYQGILRIDLAVREYRAALRKLETHAPDTLLDGVAVGWLRDTCQRKLLELSER
jgi:chemotaxis protein methyltransferase CheR